jgi:hypothetical protein
LLKDDFTVLLLQGNNQTGKENTDTKFQDDIFWLLTPNIGSSMKLGRLFLFNPPPDGAKVLLNSIPGQVNVFV